VQSVKNKLNKVVLQTNSTEVDVLLPDVVAKLRRKYAATMGDPPQEEQEVTDIQLSAYVRMQELGLPPAVDFGVWGPKRGPC